MNKEDNFLKPVIRFVHWEKQNDLEQVSNKVKIDWPDLRVFLGYIKSEKFDELNLRIIKIQELVSKIQFTPLGISLERNVATVDKCDLSVAYEIWIRNGVQFISYYSPPIDNDDFSKSVIDLKNLMLESIDKIDCLGWRERYDSPFQVSSFDWDYNEINGR